MKIIHLYGLSAMIILLGVIIWTVWSAMVYLAWIALAGGILAALIGLFRFFAPGYIQMSHEQHEQWKSTVDLQLRANMLALAQRPGYGSKFEANGTIEIYPTHATHATLPPQPKQDSLQQEEPRIPSSVRYEDIQSYIPKDHTLIGIGEGGKVDTREKEIKGLIWIPGSSGAGKSNTTGLRVQEDYERKHRFWGIDPHFFKSDSLSNLVKPYTDRFIEPIAHTQEDILHILELFIAEAEKRKAGGACWPLTLLYDEIGSQVSDKPEDDIEKQIIEKTKKAVRLAGQELRGFNMNLIAISQDAAGLAFLRKRALLVLGHKTVMMSERELVCNGRTDLARAMDEWPIGRTVVYGVALQGIFIRQQPLFTVPKVVESVSSICLPEDVMGRHQEENGEATGNEKMPEKETDTLVLKNFLNEAGKMRAKGESIDGILKKHGIAPGGRNNQNLKTLLEQESF